MNGGEETVFASGCSSKGRVDSRKNSVLRTLKKFFVELGRIFDYEHSLLCFLACLICFCFSGREAGIAKTLRGVLDNIDARIR
jgi:hypothetical protein